MTDLEYERLIHTLPAADETDLTYGDGISIKVSDLIQLIKSRDQQIALAARIESSISVLEAEYQIIKEKLPPLKFATTDNEFADYMWRHLTQLRERIDADKKSLKEQQNKTNGVRREW